MCLKIIIQPSEQTDRVLVFKDTSGTFVSTFRLQLFSDNQCTIVNAGKLSDMQILALTILFYPPGKTQTTSGQNSYDKSSQHNCLRSKVLSDI